LFKFVGVGIYPQGALLESHGLSAEPFHLLQFLILLDFFLEVLDLLIFLLDLVREFHTPQFLKLINLFFILLYLGVNLLDFRIQTFHFLPQEIQPILI
jgi:hypothetical protein